MVNAAWRLVPLPAFRLWLLDTHLDRCADCQAGLVGKAEALKVLSGKSLPFPAQLLQEEFRREGSGAGRITEPGSGLRIKAKTWLTRVYAAAATITVFILLFSFGWYFSRQKAGKDSWSYGETEKTNIVSRVSVEYVMSGGQPADAFIYYARDPEMIIIWVEARD